MDRSKDWNSRCLDSIRKEKVQIEKRCGIKIGQTEIYCARCGSSWGFGGHICQDIRFKNLQAKKKERDLERKKKEVQALEVIKEVGVRKAAILLTLPEWRVRKWVQRGSIPVKFLDKIKKCVQR